MLFALVDNHGAVGKMRATVHGLSASRAVDLALQVHRAGPTRLSCGGEFGMLQLSGGQREHIGKLSDIKPTPLALSTEVDVHPVNFDFFHSYLTPRALHSQNVLENFEVPLPGMVGAFRLESVKMRTQIVSILNKPEQYALGQELVAEYVEATAEEMAADPATFIPYIEGYSDFPGAFAPEGDFLLARVAGAEAGCVGIKPLGDGVCEMKSLWVRPAHRGAGVAKALVLASLARAGELGFRSMELDVLPSRVGAIRLYQSTGFEKCPVSHDYTFEMVGFRKALPSPKS